MFAGMREFVYAFFLIGAFAPCVVWAGFLPNRVVPFPTVPVPPATYRADGTSGILAPALFPKTVADLNQEDRIALKIESYKPFKDLNAYYDLDIESDEQFFERQRALAEYEVASDYASMDHNTYCVNYPSDEEHCGQSNGSYDSTDGDDNQGGQYSGTTIGGGSVVVNNSTRGGSCYPAAKSEYFKNEILTTGKYEKISPAFEKAMMTVFRKEGKCGQVPGDGCGYTCYGIGENCLGKTAGLNREALSKLTRGEAEDIYYKYLWQKYNVGILPDVISGEVFMSMMGRGAIPAIRQFRKFLGVNTSPKDVLDENVANAVRNYNGDIHGAWLDSYQDFLVQASKNYSDPRVLTAWMRGIKLKRENGCHVIPAEPLLRN